MALDPWRRRNFRIPLFALAAASLIGEIACVPTPDYYPPPFQRRTGERTEARNLPHVLDMADPDVESYFVRDISPALESGAWRWTYGNAQIHLFNNATGRQKIFCDIGIVDAVLNQAGGRQIVSLLLNDHWIASRKFTHPGNYHIEEDVADGALKGQEMNTVTLKADRVYTAEVDGKKLAFVLFRVGFKQP